MKLGPLPLTLLLFSSLAQATLGGDAASVQKDAKLLGDSSSTLTQHSHYKLHEIAPKWIRMHEFMDENGKIFALAWNGKTHPSFRSVLGDHFAEFQNAIIQARATHHYGQPIVIDTANLHIEMGGHMMAVHGQIFIKDQIPAGMDLHEIQ